MSTSFSTLEAPRITISGWLLAAVVVLLIHGIGVLPFWLSFNTRVPSPPPAPFLIDIAPLSTLPSSNSAVNTVASSSSAPVVEQEALPEADSLTTLKQHEDALDSAKTLENAAIAEKVAAPKAEERAEKEQEKPAEQEAKVDATQDVTQVAGAAHENLVPSESMAAPLSGEGAESLEQQLTWQHIIQAYLDRRKRYPRLAQIRKEQGVAMVSFNVTRDGSVTAVQLVSGTNSPSLDKEAVALIWRVSPLPAVPEAVVGESFSLTLPISFTL